MDRQLLIEDSLLVAQTAHRDQKDRGGFPYFGHIERVYLRAKAYLDALPAGMLTQREYEDILHAVIFHDTVEDTTLTLADLVAMGYGEGVTRRVDRVTHRPPGTSYIQNIQNMADEGDIGVIILKLSDNEDNSSPERIAQLPLEDQSIAKRYHRSMAILRPAMLKLIEQFKETKR